MPNVNFDLLDSLDGIAYIVDASGIIVDYGRRSWAIFASTNGAEELCDETNVLGRNLFDVVQGEALREAYRHFGEELLRDNTDRVILNFTCDTPAMQRKMRLAITRIQAPRVPRALLYHSVVLDERIRPAIDLFDFRAMLRLSQSRAELPIITVCSLCQRVQNSSDCPGDNREWITAEEYYRRGGTTKVRISHGVCPNCVRTASPKLN